MTPPGCRQADCAALRMIAHAHPHATRSTRCPIPSPRRVPSVHRPGGTVPPSRGAERGRRPASPSQVAGRSHSGARGPPS
eukprot:scaffold5941_cov125-Isochrysis_galbana.AAC.14